MANTIKLAAVSCLLAFASGSAFAADHHGHRARVPVTSADSSAVLYYPGWGREPVVVTGVYPGLVYGGAISAPAGRR